MRIELAKLLLQKPDVLLLDEPTNHLDIESIQWLEDFLINNGKAVIVISHDRKFVDNITTRTIEVTMGRIYDYKVNYSQYLQLTAANSNRRLMTSSRSLLLKRRSLSNGSRGLIQRRCRCRAVSKCWRSWNCSKWTRRILLHCD